MGRMVGVEIEPVLLPCSFSQNLLKTFVSVALKTNLLTFFNKLKVYEL
jgi:hypothetical protein